MTIKKRFYRRTQNSSINDRDESEKILPVKIIEEQQVYQGKKTENFQY